MKRTTRKAPVRGPTVDETLVGCSNFAGDTNDRHFITRLAIEEDRNSDASDLENTAKRTARRTEMGEVIQIWNRIKEVPSPENFYLSQPSTTKEKSERRISDVFDAIFKEIEMLTPKEVPAKCKTLRDVLESNDSLIDSNYSIPSAMINCEAIDHLQTLINYKATKYGKKDVKRPPVWTKDEPNPSLNYFTKVFHDPKTTNSAASLSSNTGPFCRICHERTGALVQPCLCRGTMAHAHVQCLQTWLTEKEINYCELCNYVFRVIHLPDYKMISSLGFWYKFAATDDQKRRIMVDLTLGVVLLPIVMFLMILARSLTSDASVQVHENEEYIYVEENSMRRAYSLILKFVTFLIHTTYAGYVFTRVNYHLSAWLSWYVNKNVTVVLEDPLS